jgi:hypothetical protein
MCSWCLLERPLERKVLYGLLARSRLISNGLQNFLESSARPIAERLSCSIIYCRMTHPGSSRNYTYKELLMWCSHSQRARLPSAPIATGVRDERGETSPADIYWLWRWLSNPTGDVYGRGVVAADWDVKLTYTVRFIRRLPPRGVWGFFFRCFLKRERWVSRRLLARLNTISAFVVSSTPLASLTFDLRAFNYFAWNFDSKILKIIINRKS